MLKSKIHRATLTGKALDYEGSIALDHRLTDAADLLPGEQPSLHLSHGKSHWQVRGKYARLRQAGRYSCLTNDPFRPR